MNREVLEYQLQEKPSFKNWLVVVAVSIGIFAVITAEQLPIGLITQISSTMSVSKGIAGLLVTVPGLIAAATAPTLPVILGQADRRNVLIGLMANMSIANLLSATASNFLILLVSRVFVGISIGGFFSLVGNLAVRLVPKTYVSRATSIIFGGVATATVLGVPFGTFIGEISNWRMAFVALSLLGIVVLILLYMLLPDLPAEEVIKLKVIKNQSTNIVVKIGLIITLLIVIGHFAAYTFVSPILQSISGIEQNSISSLLLLFGIAGIIGNFIAGIAAGHNVSLTILIITLGLVSTLLLFAIVGDNQIAGIILLIVWGLSFGGVSVSLQIWMQKAAPKAIEAASALWTSIFNLSISIGALMGGLLIESIGIIDALLVSAAFILSSTIVLLATTDI